MDPLEDILSSLQDDKSKVFKEEDVEKFLKDIEDNIEGNDKLVETVVRDKCTANSKKDTKSKVSEKSIKAEQKDRKTRGKKTYGEYACDSCEYECDIKVFMRLHKEAVHLKIKRFKCSNCEYEGYYKTNNTGSHKKEA